MGAHPRPRLRPVTGGSDERIAAPGRRRGPGDPRFRIASSVRFQAPPFSSTLRPAVDPSPAGINGGPRACRPSPLQRRPPPTLRPPARGMSRSTRPPSRAPDVRRGSAGSAGPGHPPVSVRPTVWTAPLIDLFSSDNKFRAFKLYKPVLLFSFLWNRSLPLFCARLPKLRGGGGGDRKDARDSLETRGRRIVIPGPSTSTSDLFLKVSLSFLQKRRGGTFRTQPIPVSKWAPESTL